MPQPAPTTNLVVVNPNGRVIQVIPDLSFPNGAVISADGATLIVAETKTCAISAFHFNADGTRRDRRVWAQFDVVFPDGISLDADGQLWIANAITNQCPRVREGGKITASRTTTQTSFACMLVGPRPSRSRAPVSPQPSRRSLSAESGQGPLHVAHGLVGAQFVLDQRETHVAVTAVAEADPRARRDVGLFDEKRGELE